MTGAVTLENRFLLQKYFLQILAGLSNAEIALDPQGELAFGESHQVPFWAQPLLWTDSFPAEVAARGDPRSGSRRRTLRRPLCAVWRSQQPGRDPNNPTFEDAQRQGEPVEIANAQAVAAGAPFRAVNPALTVGGAVTQAVRGGTQPSFRVPPGPSF